MLVCSVSCQFPPGERHEDAVYDFSMEVDAGIAGSYTATELMPIKLHSEGSPMAGDAVLGYEKGAASSLPSPHRLPGKGHLSAKGGVGAGLGQGRGLAVIEEERERWGGWLHEHSSSLSRGEDSKYSENPELPPGEQPFDDGVQVFRLEEEDA